MSVFCIALTRILRICRSLAVEGDKIGAAGGGLALTSSGAQGFGAVYENQRKRLGLFATDSYTGGNLIGMVDPNEFSDEDGSAKGKALLPGGWEWKIEIISGKTDQDGWQYAFAFQKPAWSNHHKRGKTWVRRRKWVPVLQQKVQRSELDQLPVAENLPACSGVLIVELFAARSLPLDPEGVAPDAVAAASLLGQSGPRFTTAARPLTQNPTWHDPSNSYNCRFVFEITAADIKQHRDLVANAASQGDFVVVDGQEPSDLCIEVQNSKPEWWAQSITQGMRRGGKDGNADNKRPISETLLGTVNIPLETLLSHRACDGWHNLQNGAGELRVCWLRALHIYSCLQVSV